MSTPCEPPSAPDGDVLRVVVEVAPFHLDRPFDYLAPEDGGPVRSGQRVMVPFSGRQVRALVIERGVETSLEHARLKRVSRVLGEHTWVTPEDLDLMRWAATRFGAPLADVVRHALPSRTVDVERRARAKGWYPHADQARAVQVAPRPETAWDVYGERGGLLLDRVHTGKGTFMWRPCPGEDLAARIVELVQLTLAGGRDVLVIVPQPVSAVADMLVATVTEPTVDLRAAATPRRRYQGWLQGRTGLARLVVGERGAVFTPLERLGLTVVVDEANPALKERRSPRHHVREVALERARRAGGVGLLVGTVPSAAAWRLLTQRRLEPVVASRQAERNARPKIHVVDQANEPRGRFSRRVIGALRTAVADGTYGVVLASRRGEGRALVCGACGEQVGCARCGASLRGDGAHWLCEACGAITDAVVPCKACGQRRPVPLAAGVARIATELRRTIDAPVAQLEGYQAAVPEAPAVLVMTRGSVGESPPGPVGAVILGDLDAMLRRPVLDASEDTLRLSMAISSWCAGTSAPVIAQTREVDHHVISSLQRWDPGGFWRTEQQLRSALRFPPASHAIRLETDAADADVALIAALAASDELLGPLPQGGRSTFLIKSDDRDATLAALRQVREQWSREGVEVRVDVDPVDVT